MKLTDLIPAPFRLWAWLAAAMVGLVAIAAAWWLLSAPQRAAQARQDSRVAEAVGKGATANAKDAIATVTDNQAASAATDKQTEEGRREILSAPGADEALDPRLTAAGRRRACLRESARRDPACQ
jgi:hypothetical protein